MCAKHLTRKRPLLLLFITYKGEENNCMQTSQDSRKALPVTGVCGVHL